MVCISSSAVHMSHTDVAVKDRTKKIHGTGM